MINLNFHPASLIMLLLSSFLLSPVTVYAISKCQDSTGKWHYGDNASNACGDATITIFNKKGRKVDEVGPPMTAEELEAEKAEEERIKLEEEALAKREMEKQRILEIYPREESILRARDERLRGMDKNIKLQEELLDGMRLEMRGLEARQEPKDKKSKANFNARKEGLQESIDAYYQSITRLRREREKTAVKYEEILTEFRDLTAEPVEQKPGD